MTEGWEAAMWAVEVKRWMCRSLRCAREESRARSGGVRALVGLFVGLLFTSLGLLSLSAGFEEEVEEAERRRGEGWPERERRISWSMVWLVGWLVSILEVVVELGRVLLGRLLDAGGPLLGAAVVECLEEEDEGSEELKPTAHRAAVG
jgi:hypothetical protein